MNTLENTIVMAPAALEGVDAAVGKADASNYTHRGAPIRLLKAHTSTSLLAAKESISTFVTKDGTKFYRKDWGEGQPVGLQPSLLPERGCF